MSPASSESQRRASCMALAAKLGKIPVAKLKSPAKDMHDSMSIKQLKDYCLQHMKEK